MKEQIIKEVSQNSGFPEKIIEKSIKKFLQNNYFEDFHHLSNEEKVKLFHKIKGTSLTIGLIEIGELAKEIEQKLKHNLEVEEDIEKIKKSLENLKIIFFV